jgi:hypothetical protein
MTKIELFQNDFEIHECMSTESQQSDIEECWRLCCKDIQQFIRFMYAEV